MVMRHISRNVTSGCQRLALALSLLLLGGCAGLVSSATSRFANNLNLAVLNQPDPGIVRDGAPAYLLLLDSLIEGNPDDAATLSSAANLYSAYGAVFADDPQRAKILTARALKYAERAICLVHESGCGWPTMTYDEFAADMAKLTGKNAEIAGSYGLASLVYIRAHADDWAALARLPHIETLLLALVPFEDEASLGALYNYLGILNTLRPPALGGDPELGRSYFERALMLTQGRDLSIKVEYARGYARMLYEQELHDQLLNEVVSANPEAPGLTLTNTLAQRDAAELLESGKDYF